MRSRDYIGIAVKDLRRQLARSSLTIIALVISTTILVTMAAISIGGQQAIRSQFGPDTALANITVTPNQSSGTLSPFGSVQEVNSQTTKLTDDTTKQLLQIPHVAAVSARAHIWEIHHFSIEGSDKQFVAQANGVSADSAIATVAGEKLTSSSSPESIVIGQAYAKELGVNPTTLVGKTVMLTMQKGYRGEGANIPPVGASQQANEAFNQTEATLKAKIIGVAGEGADQNGLFMSLEQARALRTARYNELAGQKKVDQLAADGYTSMLVTTDTTANVKAVSVAIEQLGYGQISTLSQIERLQQFATMMWVILGAVAFIAVIAAALGVANTMLMAVSEQRYTIGVWRAVGARRGTIVRMFLVQAALLGLIGGVIGAGLGMIVSTYINTYINTLLGAQGLTLATIAAMPLWLPVGTIVLTTLFGILAGLYPAYRAARQDPSAALSSGQ